MSFSGVKTAGLYIPSFLVFLFFLPPGSLPLSPPFVSIMDFTVFWDFSDSLKDRIGTGLRALLLSSACLEVNNLNKSACSGAETCEARWCVLSPGGNAWFIHWILRFRFDEMGILPRETVFTWEAYWSRLQTGSCCWAVLKLPSAPARSYNDPWNEAAHHLWTCPRMSASGSFENPPDV